MGFLRRQGRSVNSGWNPVPTSSNEAISPLIRSLPFVPPCGLPSREFDSEGSRLAPPSELPNGSFFRCTPAPRFRRSFPSCLGHLDLPQTLRRNPRKNLEQSRFTRPIPPNNPEQLMPSPPEVRYLGCTKAFLRNLFFGPSQGP